MTPSATVRKGHTVIWTRDKVIERIQRWVMLYGEPPRAADWNPSSARWSNAEWRVARYRKGDPETGEPWPSLNTAKAPFGNSLVAAIVAAGFEPNRSGPPSRRSLGSLHADHEEMSPRARVALNSALVDIKALNEQVATLRGQLDRARVGRAELVLALDAARRAHKAASARASRVTPTKSRTVTKTKTVRVEDTRTVKRLEAKAERLEARLADAEALTRAEKDRGAAALRDLRKLRAKWESSKLVVDELRTEAREFEHERKALEDKLVAAEAASKRERVVIKERVVRSASDQEVADARKAVAVSEKAADEAEVRAARAERELRELAALVTGENRRLTAAELVGLRKGGPSGPAVLARALKELAVARRRDSGHVSGALLKIASAAIRWRDAL